MADYFEQLNDQQKVAVVSLATGASNKEVAQKIGKHSNTILNWKKKPAIATRISLLQLAIRDIAEQKTTKRL